MYGNSNIKFKTPSSGSRDVTFTQTDREMDGRTDILIGITQGYERARKMFTQTFEAYNSSR